MGLEKNEESSIFKIPNMLKFKIFGYKEKDENKDNKKVRSIINSHSKYADLTIVGFRGELLKKQKETLFNGYEKLGNVMFVNSQSKKQIIYSQDE